MKHILLILLLPLTSMGQGFKIKDHYPALTAIFISGAADGVRDASMFHMKGKGQFWDGSISWENKYKDGKEGNPPAYFGSTTFLVWTTDAPHLFNMISNQAMSFSVSLYPQKQRKFKHIVRDAVIYNVTRQAGHYLMYSIILD